MLRRSQLECRGCSHIQIGRRLVSSGWRVGGMRVGIVGRALEVWDRVANALIPCVSIFVVIAMVCVFRSSRRAVCQSAV